MLVPGDSQLQHYIVLYSFWWHIFAKLFLAVAVIKCKYKVKNQWRTRNEGGDVQLDPKVWAVAALNRCIFLVIMVTEKWNEFFFLSLYHYFFLTAIKLLWQHYLLGCLNLITLYKWTGRYLYWPKDIMKKLEGLWTSELSPGSRDSPSFHTGTFPVSANFESHFSECPLASYLCRIAFYLSFNGGHPI